MVERRSPKPDVEGSSPSGRDFKKNKRADMATVQKNNTQQEKTSFKESLTTYFKGVKAEWGKISWPQKNQIIFETGVVLFVVITFTILVFLMDVIFKGLLGLLPQ